MVNKLISRSGQSLVEYATLVVIIISVFLLFQKYVALGMAGRWKQAGDSAGFERTFDLSTRQCGNDVFTDRLNVWYEEKCFRNNCFDACIKFKDTIAWDQAACRTCIDSTCPCPP